MYKKYKVNLGGKEDVMDWKECLELRNQIIAMLHIDPLPGDPLYKSGNDMDKVVEHAREDLHALQDGGVDGIIFSNEFSLPYQRNMDMVTPAAMAYVIWEFTIWD